MRQGFPEAVWYPSPNFGYGSRPWNYGRVGRPGDQPITRVIIHTTEVPEVQGSLNSITNVPLDRDLDSAHYLVAEDGVYQLVDDRNVAWHAADQNPFSIGVETVGRAGDPSTWSPGIIDNWGKLAGWLSWAYQIPLHYVGGVNGVPDEALADRGFMGHGAVVRPGKRRSDPGVYFPWGQIRQRAVTYQDQAGMSSMMAGLDPSQIVQGPQSGHPHEPPPAGTSPNAPPPSADPPQVMTAGIGAGPALPLLVGAVALALWANR